ncbi:single-stranded DNA-binding protein [Aurantimonas sp. VKM B-3413]|uniref:single-stranded DNA-binding protein n=1 Tax=Aurantimonas sp. VKM B-3413 TaxID=2779401 RepID=UPI001E294D97|nr:single-stranded DNA-binding protein [Aurantimonas sp. VKM B-3413]MCB8839365.1 single-stranded DNA-binding protein [Aurantimonas sp. VKM B-3413]
MTATATFEIIGRVARIAAFANATRLTIASNYRVRDDKNEWRDDTHWNEVVVFSPQQLQTIAETIAKGDLVRTTGRIRQSRYEKNGETIFATDLLVREFALLARPGAAKADQSIKQESKRKGAMKTAA